jgi:hypothetical protein
MLEIIRLAARYLSNANLMILAIPIELIATALSNSQIAPKTIEWKVRIMFFWIGLPESLVW